MAQDKINEILKPNSETTQESVNEQIQKIKNLELQLWSILKDLKQDINTDNYEQVWEWTSQIDELFRQKFRWIKNIDELEKWIENKSEILNFLTTVFDEWEKVVGEINKKNNWEKTKNNLNWDILKTWKIINEFMPENYFWTEKSIFIIEYFKKTVDIKNNIKLNNFLELFKKPEKNKKEIQEIYFKNFIWTHLWDLILDLGFLKINTILRDSNKKVETNSNKIFNLFSKLLKNKDDSQQFAEDSKYLACKIPEKNLSSLLSTFEVIFDWWKSFEVEDFVDYIKEEWDIKYAIDIMDNIDFYINENDYDKNKKLQLLKNVNEKLKKDYEENILSINIEDFKKDWLYEKIYWKEWKISKEKFYKKLDNILDNYTKEWKIINYLELRDELNQILPEKNQIEKPSDLYDLLWKRQRQIVEQNEEELLNILNWYIDYNKINSLDNLIKNKLNNELNEYKITKKPEKILSILIDNWIIPAANFQDNWEGIIKTLLSKQILISLDIKKDISVNTENKITEWINQSTPEWKKEALEKINKKPQEIIELSEKTYNKVKEKWLIWFWEWYWEILWQISDEVISKSIDKDWNINSEIFDKNLNKYFEDHTIKITRSERVEPNNLEKIKAWEKLFIIDWLNNPIILTKNESGQNFSIKTENSIINCKTEEVKDIISNITFFQDNSLDFLVSDMANWIDFKWNILSAFSWNKNIDFELKNWFEEKEKKMILSTFKKILFWDSWKNEDLWELSNFFKLKSKNDIIDAMQNKWLMTNWIINDWNKQNLVKAIQNSNTNIS